MQEPIFEDGARKSLEFAIVLPEMVVPDYEKSFWDAEWSQLSQPLSESKQELVRALASARPPSEFSPALTHIDEDFGILTLNIDRYNLDWDAGPFFSWDGMDGSKNSVKLDFVKLDANDGPEYDISINGNIQIPEIPGAEATRMVNVKEDGSVEEIRRITFPKDVDIGPQNQTYLEVGCSIQNGNATEFSIDLRSQDPLDASGPSVKLMAESDGHVTSQKILGKLDEVEVNTLRNLLLHLIPSFYTGKVIYEPITK